MNAVIHGGVAKVLTVLLACALGSGAAGAEQQVEDRAPAPSLGRQVDDQRLAGVRGGYSFSSRVVVPPVGVILWDEPGRLPQPIRTSVGATQQISGRMSTFYR
jgi:hypothetical protein